MAGLSFLQGRYPPTQRGDNFLLLRDGTGIVQAVMSRQEKP